MLFLPLYSTLLAPPHPFLSSIAFSCSPVAPSSHPTCPLLSHSLPSILFLIFYLTLLSLHPLPLFLSTSPFLASLSIPSARYLLSCPPFQFLLLPLSPILNFTPPLLPFPFPSLPLDPLPHLPRRSTRDWRPTRYQMARRDSQVLCEITQSEALTVLSASNLNTQAMHTRPNEHPALLHMLLTSSCIGILVRGSNSSVVLQLLAFARLRR